MLKGCPFCHHSDSVVYRTRQELRRGGSCNLLKCNECGLLYPQQRMDELETKEYLFSLFTNQDDYQYDEPRVEITENRVPVKLISPIEKRGRSLDIGTFNGKYTYIWEALGFDSYGLEPQDKAAEFAKTRGLKVFCGSFPDAIPSELLEEKFSLISMLEMVCYIHDLKAGLLKAKELLDDDGLLLIQCHQGYSRYYDSNNSYFSRYGDNVQGIPSLGSLLYCLSKSGFDVVKYAGFVDTDFEKKLHYKVLNMDNADRLVLLAKKVM